MNLPAHINKLRLQVSTPNPSTKLTSTLLGLFLLTAILFPQPAHAGFFSQIKCFFIQIFTSNSCGKEQEVTAPNPPTKEEKVTENPLTLEDIQSLIDKNLLTYEETHPYNPVTSKVVYLSNPNQESTNNPTLITVDRGNTEEGSKAESRRGGSGQVLSAHTTNPNFVTYDALDRQVAAIYNSFENTLEVINTSNITEGTKLFYTDTRVADYINASSTLSISSTNYWTKSGTDLTYTDGNVGVGTSSPSKTLSVQGDALISGDLNVANLTATGTISFLGTATTTFSGGVSAAGLSSSLGLTVSGATYLATSGGNVGVGSSTPSAKLSVKGDGTTTGRAFAVSDSSDVERFTILDNGKVGIGIGNPGASLSVSQNVTSGAIAAEFDSFSTSLTAAGRIIDIERRSTGDMADGFGPFIGFIIEDTAAVENVIGDIGFRRSGADNSGTFHIRPRNAGSTVEAVVVTNQGNVGIWVTNPQTLLDIAATSTDTGWGNQLNFRSFRAAIVSGNLLGGLTFTSNDTTLTAPGTTTAAIQALANVTHTASALGTDIVFKSTTGTTYAELMRLTGAGLLGIGTSTPTQKLHIVSDSSSQGLKLSGNQGYTFLEIKDAGGSDDGIFELKQLGVTKVQFETGGSAISYINTGNVGIGTTAPTFKFQVSGGTVGLMSLTNSEGGGVYACVLNTGQVATSSAACGSSSRRFKDDIENISYGLDEVMNLRPVSFDYNQTYGFSGLGHQIGFIAEEVAEIIPEVIGYHDGQIQSVDYPKLTAVLTRAVQELNTKVDGLTNTSSSRSSNSSPTTSLPIGQASSTTAPVIVDDSFIGEIVAFLNTLYDVVIERGLLRVAHLVSEKITTKNLTITESFIMYDKKTNTPYCITIERGDFVSTKGFCEENDVDTTYNSNNNSAGEVEDLPEELKTEEKEISDPSLSAQEMDGNSSISNQVPEPEPEQEEVTELETSSESILES